MGKKKKKQKKPKKQKKSGSAKGKVRAKAMTMALAGANNLDKIIAEFQKDGFYRVIRYKDALPDLGPTNQVLESLAAKLQIAGLSSDFEAALAKLRKVPGSDDVTAAIEAAMKKTDGLRILAIEMNRATRIFTFGFGFDFSPETINYNGIGVVAFGLEVQHLSDSAASESAQDG